MASKKEVVAVAGVGDLGKYICEEFFASPDFTPVVLTRNTAHIWATTQQIIVYQTDYTTPSLLRILNLTSATTLISFISPTSSQSFLPIHIAMLEACSLSKKCKRFIPAEWAGDTVAYPSAPLFFKETRTPLRELLRAQKAVQWTVVAIGWLADYFLPYSTNIRQDEEIKKADDNDTVEEWKKRTAKTYMRPVPEMWPVDTVKWEACVRGTGDEGQSWVCGRDVGKAVVALCRAEEWEQHTYITAEWSTFNEAIKFLESYYDRPMLKTNRSIKEIEKVVKSNDWADSAAHAAQVEEMSVKEQLSLPREETLRQREKFFKDIEFRGLEQLIKDAEKGGFI